MNKNKKILNSLMRSIRIIQNIEPLYIIYILFESILRVSLPFVIAFLSSEILTEIAKKNTEKLFELVFLNIIIVLCITLFQAFLTRKISIKKYSFNAHYEKLISEKSYNMDFNFAEDSKTSELRAQIDTNKITFGGGISSVVFDISDIVANIISILISSFFFFEMLNLRNNSFNSFSNFLRIVIPIFLVFTITLSSIFQKKMLEKNFEMFNQMSKFNQMSNYYTHNYLDENKAAKEIRIFKQNNFISNLYYNTLLEPIWNRTKTSLNLSQKWQVLNDIFTSTLSGLVYIFITLNIFNGTFEIGKIVFYYTIATTFLISCSSLVKALLNFSNNTNYLNLLFEYLDLPETKNLKETNVIKPNFILESIEFHNVSFKYPNTNTYTLKNLSFKINSGDHIAIVGVNGSGKSTIVKLLCGFYEPTDGYISINGKNITQYDKKEYQKIFSTVFQDFKLLSFTIANNIAGDIVANSKKVWSCLFDVKINDKINRLPNDINSYIYSDFEDSGIEFSGGEEQKLAIARSLYKNSLITILDEPTAALDPFSEATIFEDYKNSTEHKTTIFITHRLSSCNFCNKIIVVDDGCIVQEGSHQDLVKDSHGIYRKLWDSQANLYQHNLQY